MRFPFFCFLTLRLAVAVKLIEGPSPEVLYDNPWNLPMETSVAPGVTVDFVRLSEGGWWEIELRVAQDPARYNHTLFLANVTAEYPAFGHPVKDAFTNSSPWLTLNLDTLENRTNFPNGIQAEMSLIGTDFANMTLVLCRLNPDISTPSPLDISLGLASVHYDMDLGGFFDSIFTVAARVFPDVFQAEPIALTITVEHQPSFVLDHALRVLLHPAPSPGDPPLTFVELTLVVPPASLQGIEVLSAEYGILDYTSTNSTPGLGPGEWGNFSSWISMCSASVSTQILDNCTRGVKPSGCSHEINTFFNESTPRMEPIVATFLFPISYTDQLSYGRTQLTAHFALQGRTLDNSKLLMQIASALELPASVTHCSDFVYIPRPSPEYVRVNEHVYIGGALSEVNVEKAVFPVYAVEELQRFALMDGLVTLALLGVDDHFSTNQANSVNLHDLYVVRVKNDVVYSKLKKLLALGLAYNVHPTTATLTMSNDVLQLCNDPLSKCLISQVWKSGEVSDASQVMRMVEKEDAVEAFVDQVPPVEARGSEMAVEARNAFLDKVATTLKPDATKRAVYLINSRKIQDAPGQGNEFVLFFSSHLVK